jgi:leucyl-tRNA synthetase
MAIKKTHKILGKFKVFLVPGTLRPETMYGQTNIWVHPDLEYGCYQVNDTEAFICTARSARNMAFQNLSKTPKEVTALATFTGADIMGIPVKAPLSQYPVVYTLPMTTISPKKGTGIVTSVPSDAPDDYINLEELRRKPAYRQKLGLTDEMVMPFQVIPIIDVPEYGTTAAAKACADLKVILIFFSQFFSSPLHEETFFPSPPTLAFFPSQFSFFS